MAKFLKGQPYLNKIFIKANGDNNDSSNINISKCFIYKEANANAEFETDITKLTDAIECDIKTSSPSDNSILLSLSASLPQLKEFNRINYCNSNNETIYAVIVETLNQSEIEINLLIDLAGTMQFS